jgi:MoaA/NifB/PqqE/SkfB family radical SAM enzyme
MDFREIPDHLDLDDASWSLLVTFFLLHEEPRDRLPHLGQMEEDQLERALQRLSGAGLVVRRADGDGERWSLRPIDAWLSPDAPDGRDPDRWAMEAGELRRLRDLRGFPRVTVIANREMRDRRRLVPEVLHHATTTLPAIDLRVGTRCNLNCTYCLLGHEDRYLRPVEEIAAELALGRERGIEKVSFTGGEPTLHPELPRMVSLARRMGYRQVVLVTNGLTLSIPGVLDRLVSLGVTAVGISFDTPDRATAASLWQVDALDRVKAAFDAVGRHPELPLGSIAVVTRPTIPQLADLARFFVELKGRIGNPFVPNLDFVMPEENAWLHRDALVPRLSEAVPAVAGALAIAHAHGLPLTFRGFPPCLLRGYETWSYDRYMTIFQLVRTPDGVVFDRAVIDALRTKAPGCLRCVHYRECTGVSRSYANRYGLSELQPVEATP